MRRLRCHAPTSRPGKPRSKAGRAGGVPPRAGLASLAVMSWTWQLEDPAGAPVDPATLGVEVPECDNQGDAESWLGEAVCHLLERGIATVTLTSRTASGVYGPMGLAAT